MMKKFFYLAMAVATLTMSSCNDDDDIPVIPAYVAPTYDTYVGTMSAKTAAQGGGTNKYDMEKAVIYASETDGTPDTLTLTLNNALFHDNMAEAIPGGINIILPNIPETIDDTYYADSVAATNPAGIEYGERFKVTDVEVTEANDTLKFSFKVALAGELFGEDSSGRTLTFTVTFTGIEL